MKQKLHVAAIIVALLLGGFALAIAHPGSPCYGGPEQAAAEDHDAASTDMIDGLRDAERALRK